MCTVEAETGRVSALASGTCTLSASQAGDTTWAAVTQQQQLAVSPDLRFDDIGDLVVGDAAMLTVSTPRGQKVRYRSETPTVCSMDASSGLMTALAAGTCTVVAEVEGAASGQTKGQFTIAAAPAVTAPSAPEQVSARLGTETGTVQVQAKRIRGGGTAVTRYSVTSTPAGIRAEGTSLPVTVNCPPAAVPDIPSRWRQPMHRVPVRLRQQPK